MSDQAKKKTGGAIAGSVLELIGGTPLVRLNRLPKPGSAEVLAKLEWFTPGGSIKDRVALSMIEDAEARGLLGPDTVIIEPTSGNTGIGLAAVSAAKGYRCVLVMPDSMSMERLTILRRFGAEVVLTPAREDMAGAVKKANQLAASTPNSFVPLQFENPSNPEAHRRSTAREILAATEGRLDALVAGVGTGGTITGLADVLRRELPALRVIAVEPARSPMLSKGVGGHHKIQGIGAGFVPKVLDRALLDEVRTVGDGEAFEMMGRLAASEGILAGVSSGAAMHVALALAAELGSSQRIIVILPDTGERYLSLQQYFEV